MNLQLNCKAVTDEILALSALRCATSAKSHRLITRDQLPGLRIIMRMVFAELMVELTGLVDTCNIDTEDPDPTLPYDDTTPLTLEVGLKNSDSFSPGIGTDCETDSSNTWWPQAPWDGRQPRAMRISHARFRTGAKQRFQPYATHSKRMPPQSPVGLPATGRQSFTDDYKCQVEPPR